MTLRELIKISCGSLSDIPCPKAIGILEIEDYQKICNYYLMKYFYSEDFQWDMNNCQLDYEDVIYSGLQPYLKITIKSDIPFIQLLGEEKEFK